MRGSRGGLGGLDPSPHLQISNFFKLHLKITKNMSRTFLAKSNNLWTPAHVYHLIYSNLPATNFHKFKIK